MREFKERTEPIFTGESVLGSGVKDARRKVLDTFELNHLTNEVKYESDEVTALCPVTGQPDWYKVEIYLHNSSVGIESKSLKLYLQSFRNDGIFCEEFAAQIAEMVNQATGAAVNVVVTQRPRGGVTIEAYAEVTE